MSLPPRLTRLLDFLGSLPCGISLLVLLLAYCWLGSAGTQPFYDWFPRQSFELTELEWFSWWPFQALLVLFSISLILVTVRRIPRTLPNLGVWVVHAGILVLLLGCALYFGLKREGDLVVYRRQALLRAGPGGAPVVLPLAPGASTTVAGPAGAYRVEVGDLNSQYELLTGAAKGQRTLSVQLSIQPLGSGQPFIRQLLVGHPEFTEDVVPGQGRAIKVLGRKIIDPALDIALDYAPQERVWLNDAPALLARRPGAAEWTELPLARLPRYHEALPALDAAFVPPDLPLRAHPLDLRPTPAAGPALPAGLDLTVTGFLPYAQFVQRQVPGGDQFGPYVHFVAQAGASRVEQSLLANDPAQRQTRLADAVDARFVWVPDAAALERLRHPGAPTLSVRLPGVTQDIPLGGLIGQRVALGSTGYSLTGVQFYPRWAPSGANGDEVPMALVRVDSPHGSYMRAVVYPEGTFSEDLDLTGKRLGRIADTSLQLSLGGIVESGLTFAGGPFGVHALLVSDGGQVLDQPLAVGQEAQFLGGALRITLRGFGPNSHTALLPRIVPRAERDTKAGPAYSLLQVALGSGDRRQAVWLEYSHYGHPSRNGYFPRLVTLADGSMLELLYSRQSLRLPTAVALEEFQLETYPGGNKERDFKSLVRFYDGGRPGEVVEVHSNHPTERAGWWYFQSTWDPPDPQSGYAGMNYTGLGVGNRHGVGTMLLGSVMTVLGTLWAFYVKPVILRRRLARRSAASAPAPHAPGDVVPAAVAATAARSEA